MDVPQIFNFGGKTKIDLNREKDQSIVDSRAICGYRGDLCVFFSFFMQEITENVPQSGDFYKCSSGSKMK